MKMYQCKCGTALYETPTVLHHKKIRLISSQVKQRSSNQFTEHSTSQKKKRPVSSKNTSRKYDVYLEKKVNLRRKLEDSEKIVVKIRNRKQT